MKWAFLFSSAGFYIWAEDLSATVESDLILGVTDETTIAFDYYLSSSAELPQHVYFQNGLEPVLLGVLDVTGEWTTFNYTCEADVVCPNKTQDSCAGKVTQNTVPPSYKDIQK